MVQSKVSFFPTVRAGLIAGIAVAALLLTPGARAQDATPAPAQAPSATQAAPADTTAQPAASSSQTTKKSSFFTRGAKRNAPAPAAEKDTKKDQKVVQSKDTRNKFKKDKKIETMAGVDQKLPDKALFDKAQDAISKGHFDVARLDLQTMLNTYPDSQYLMRAKLAIADSWYKEGGTAALTQAESEYADFRVFFPNAPEAAEAQMRIGDIYFRQMDKPDRDYAKATHAEEEYRRMLTDYPDSTLVPQAQQRLRDVQEVLATREADIASYYATRDNWSAVIARYQTVIDTYPLYSHMDDALIGLGDAYAAQSHYVRTLRLPEGPKAKLEATFDGMAADAYRKVILDHSAAPHVEDARDRLDAMGLAIPSPTLAQVQASQALENSRNSYKLTDRVGLMILHRPDTVTVAHLGDPTLTDPKATIAPDVRQHVLAEFTRAMLDPNAAAKPADGAAGPANPEATAKADNAPAANVEAAPLALQDVPAATDGNSNTTTFTSTPGSSTAPAGSGATGANSMGFEVLSPGARTGGTNAALPPVEKPDEAPNTVNEISAPTAAAQKPAANGKNGKPEFDKSDESSSKHKKKKGIKKVVPF